MKIAEVIERVDALYPNTYTSEEKLGWCYDVSRGIRDNIKKIYAAREQVISKENEAILLPEGLEFSDVDSVSVNGRVVKKVDARSYDGARLKPGDRVRVVYKSLPEPYALVDGAVPEEFVTEVSAPYDGLYADYVCAQIAFYQNDLSDYNKFITMYNEKLRDYAIQYIKTAPVTERRFENLWM